MAVVYKGLFHGGLLLPRHHIQSFVLWKWVSSKRLCFLQDHLQFPRPDPSAFGTTTNLLTMHRGDFVTKSALQIY